MPYISYEQLPLTLNAKDLQQFLGISRSSVYRLLRSPDFPKFQVGRRRLVTRDAFLRWVEQQTVNVDPNSNPKIVGFDE